MRVSDSPAASIADLRAHVAAMAASARPALATGVAEMDRRLGHGVLRIEPGALAAAGRFGLERVADLLPLPRGPLARRLGLKSVERLDQAIGRIAEPIVPVLPLEAPTAERRLLEPIGTAEAIATVIRDVVEDLVDVLRTRGLGARAIELTAARVMASTSVW